MEKTVLGLFRTKEDAEDAVRELRNSGYNENEISIVARREGNEGMEGARDEADNSIAGGTTTGGIIGGLAGLALGAGALTIPGLGPIIAAGPLAGLLSGTAAGGIAGGLIDWGIPGERGRYYETKVREGRIMAAVRTSDDRVENAAEILRRNGAEDVETH